MYEKTLLNVLLVHQSALWGSPELDKEWGEYRIRTYRENDLWEPVFWTEKIAPTADRLAGLTRRKHRTLEEDIALLEWTGAEVRSSFCAWHERCSTEFPNILLYIAIFESIREMSLRLAKALLAEQNENGGL